MSVLHSYKVYKADQSMKQMRETLMCFNIKGTPVLHRLTLKVVFDL